MDQTELRRLVGRLFCVGFPGAQAEEAPLAEMEELAPAGVILFARNVSDVAGTRRLVERVTAAADATATPIVAVDQETGRVARVPGLARRVASTMALGATDDPALIEEVASTIGDELRAVGANLDFAPVADLAVESRNTVIGLRSFGDEPARVARAVTAFIRGLRGSGIAAVAKHFPGHGGTVADTHTDSARLDVDRATLEARELVPFRAAIAANVDGVMAAHVVISAFDAAAPASRSRAVMRTLLRERLGFDGACVTDCLEMAAFDETVGVERGAVLALEAGADLLVVSHRLDRARAARDAIVDAVVRGGLAIERVREADRRVTRLRRGLVTGDRPAREAQAASVERLAASVAARALVGVRGSIALAAGSPVTIISFEDDPHGEPNALNLALRRRRVRSEVMRAPLMPSEEMIAHLRQLIGLQPGREVIVLVRRAHIHAMQHRALETILAAAPDAIVVSLAEPFDLALVPQAHRMLCTFGETEATIEALADALTGRLAPTGRLPVRLATTTSS